MAPQTITDTITDINITIHVPQFNIIGNISFRRYFNSLLIEFHEYVSDYLIKTYFINVVSKVTIGYDIIAKD